MAVTCPGCKSDILSAQTNYYLCLRCLGRIYMGDGRFEPAAPQMIWRGKPAAISPEVPSE